MAGEHWVLNWDGTEGLQENPGGSNALEAPAEDLSWVLENVGDGLVRLESFLPASECKQPGLHCNGAGRSGPDTSWLGPERNMTAEDKKRGPRPRHFAKHKCQVDACAADLSCASYYYQRNHICAEHLKQESIIVRGVPSRFCQRCGVSHDLASFDGRKKSCRQALARHKMRRLKKLGPGCAPGEEIRPELATGLLQGLSVQQKGLACNSSYYQDVPSLDTAAAGHEAAAAAVPVALEERLGTPQGPARVGASFSPMAAVVASRGLQVHLASGTSCSRASSVELYALPDPPPSCKQPTWEQLASDEDDLFSMLGLPSLGELDALGSELRCAEQAERGQEAVAESEESMLQPAQVEGGAAAAFREDKCLEAELGGQPVLMAPALDTAVVAAPHPSWLSQQLPMQQEHQVPAPAVLQLQSPAGCHAFPSGTTFTLQWVAPTHGAESGPSGLGLQASASPMQAVGSGRQQQQQQQQPANGAGWMLVLQPALVAQGRSKQQNFLPKL